VTENGAGGSDRPDRNDKVRDPKRVKYFEAYVAALQEAIRSGADVRGYFVWSLLDNFEWGSGYANRFGLVYVDYATQQRIPKTSYGWYADLIKGARTPTRKA
jgi:beta-glucosidase